MSPRPRGALLDALLAQADSDAPLHSKAWKEMRRFKAEAYLAEQYPAVARGVLQAAALATAGRLKRVPRPLIGDERDELLRAIKTLLDARKHLPSRDVGLVDFLALEHGPCVPSAEQLRFLGDILAVGGIVDQQEADQRARDKQAQREPMHFAVEMLRAGAERVEPPTVVGPAELRALAIFAGLGNASTDTWTQTRGRALRVVAAQLRSVLGHVEQQQRRVRDSELCPDCVAESEELDEAIAGETGKDVATVREERAQLKQAGAESTRQAIAKIKRALRALRESKTTAADRRAGVVRLKP